ncbi:hypothetical protein ABW19_dt0208876 [Dactylella cylindrospora]|nr:hypothetical protein ABW19_dt0208876 [Dactylella cylindrospora]
MAECSATCGLSCCGAANFIVSTIWWFGLSFFGAFLALTSFLLTAAAGYGAYLLYKKAMDTWHWLLARIDALEAGLKKEIQDRIAGDTLLKGLLDQETVARIDGDKIIKGILDQEIKDRIAGDSLLQALVDKEHAEHSTAEQKLNDLLTKEHDEHTAAEKHLDDLLNKEHTEHSAAEKHLNDLLDQEAAARKSAEASLQNSVNDNRGRIDGLQQTKQDKGSGPANAPANVDANSDPALLDQLKKIGNCQFGYAWHRDGAGYRCDGGSHYVSDQALGWYAQNS